MEIWLDTTQIETIQYAERLGILKGVTTNPTLIAGAKRPMQALLEEILQVQEGFVTVQATGRTWQEMVKQGQALYAFSNRIIVKVPITKQGLEAIHTLASEGIPTMATVLFHPRQALMAALAGAYYVAPYLSRIEAGGENPMEMLAMTQDIFRNYQLQTKILAASIHHVQQVLQCASLGIFGATLKADLFEKLIVDHPLTEEGVDRFEEDWKQVSEPLFT
ncbi:MAG: hypothetical protein LW832_02825 [Parachlamydia sp.]|jgi:transaldolase|nr:hypothetical protein [Parachlamydia sp.]